MVMFFFSHEFKEHVFRILFSDWPILIFTYFYGTFTAKKQVITIKSDHLRKKTIPICGGTFSMMKKNLKMAIEFARWGKYGLSNESLSGVDWLGGCGGICGNDVLFRFELLHYCNN